MQRDREREGEREGGERHTQIELVIEGVEGVSSSLSLTHESALN